VVRIFCGALTIGGFFLLFPSLMTDPIYRTAVILYFMSPTGFALSTQLKPLVKDDSEEAFMSSFISIFMIITLIVYVIVVLTY
jgi:predicted permease